MRLPLAVLLTSVALLAAPAGAQSNSSPDLQSVLAASGKAMGAAELASVRGWHYHGSGVAAGLPATFDGWVDRSTGAEATYAKIPPVSGDSGYDGRDAWSRDDKGVVWVDGSVAGRAQAINQLYRDAGSLWSPDHGGARVELAARQKDGGATYDVVRVTPAGSAVSFDYWFDATTHLPMRVVETEPPVTTTTTFADYRTVAGLEVAFSQKSVTSQGNEQTLVVDRVDRDPAELAARVREPKSTVDDFSIAGGTQSTIPFDLVDNHVYLYVMLNGKGPYRFIFDTGGANIIDPAVAHEIGATSVGSVQGSGVGAGTEESGFARVASLRVGAAELRDQTFVVLPVRTGFGVSASAAADGLIGWEVLARFVTTFDYGKRQVTFSTAPAQARGTTTAFVFGGTQPQMPCAIDGIASVCSIDTGSRAAIDIYGPFIAAHPDVVPRNATEPGVNGFGVGGAAMGRLGRLSRLELGGYQIPDVIAGFSTDNRGAFAAIGIGGNVGGEIWKNFTVTFDYPRRTISLAPNANFGERETYDRSGIFAILQGGKIVVAAVRASTPAATAGIAKGDVIASIDGSSGSQLTLATVRAAFRRPPGTVLALSVVGKGAPPRAVNLTLQDYI